MIIQDPQNGFLSCLQKPSMMEEEEFLMEDVGGQDEDGSDDDEDGLPYVRSKDPVPRRITDNRCARNSFQGNYFKGLIT